MSCIGEIHTIHGHTFRIAGEVRQVEAERDQVLRNPNVEFVSITYPLELQGSFAAQFPDLDAVTEGQFFTEHFLPQVEVERRRLELEQRGPWAALSM